MTKQLKGEKVYFDSHFEGIIHHFWGDLAAGACRRGHVPFSVKKQRVTSAVTQLTLSMLSSPQLKVILSPQVSNEDTALQAQTESNLI